MTRVAASRRPSLRGLPLMIAAALCLGAPRASLAHALAPSLLELTEGEGGRVEVRFKTPARVPAGSVELWPALPQRCRLLGPPHAVREEAALEVRFAVDCGAAGLVGQRIGISGLVERSSDALVRVALADGRQVRDVLSVRRPCLRVPDVEATGAVAGRYLALGVEHILLGLDHLLFVLGLLLLVRGRRALIGTVTAFTLGHSVTLTLAARGWTALPPALVEVAIAASILVLAVELAGPPAVAGAVRRGRQRPWVLAALFGLLHGLGFAGALAEVGLPPRDTLLALVTFNAGIEVGQLLFVGAALLLWRAALYLPVRLPGRVVQLPIYAMGTLASYWIFERAAALF